MNVCESLDHGMDVVGSTESIALALKAAVRNGRAKVLDTLLGYPEGDDDTRQWCMMSTLLADGLPLSHVAVHYSHLATVSVLLPAGADEIASDENGRCASEITELREDIDLATEAGIL